jgi:hypothetical protein
MKEKRGRLVVSALNFFISLSTTKKGFSLHLCGLYLLLTFLIKGAKFLHEEQAGKLLLSWWIIH